MPATAVFSVLPLWLLPAHVPALVAAGATQLIAFSSTSVFAKADSPDPAEQALAQRLASAESALAKACEAVGVPWTILRPTLIYGSGRDQNVSAVARFIRRFGFFPVAHPASGLRQPVHADDLAIAAVSAIANPNAFNRAFNLPGGETLTYREMIARIFAGVGAAPRILPLPSGLLRRALPLVQNRLPHRYSPALFLRMNQDLAFDGAEAHAALNYAPRPFTLEFTP
jgi:nucleoside-diphosphate-sugar epimerase